MLKYYIHLTTMNGFDMLGPFTDQFDVIKTVHLYRQRSSTIACSYKTVNIKEEVK